MDYSGDPRGKLWEDMLAEKLTGCRESDVIAMWVYAEEVETLTGHMPGERDHGLVRSVLERFEDDSDYMVYQHGLNSVYNEPKDLYFVIRKKELPEGIYM